jgi:hypothetical protein
MSARVGKFNGRIAHHAQHELQRRLTSLGDAIRDRLRALVAGAGLAAGAGSFSTSLRQAA